MDTGSQQSEGRTFARTLPTVAATYLTALAVFAYPLGFLTLWVQVWREYTHDPTTALYAVYLIPVAVVIVKALGALGVALFLAFGVNGIIGNAVIYGSYIGIHGEEIRAKFSHRRFLHFLQSFLVSKVWRVAFLLAAVLVAVLMPPFVELVSIDSGVDAFYYTCSVLVAGGGAAVGFVTLVRHTFAEYNGQRTPYVWLAFLTMVSSVVIAALFLIPLQPTKFPVVRFSEGTVETARLIAHADGYWYVIAEGEREVVALPDDAVGKATVSEGSPTEGNDPPSAR